MNKIFFIFAAFALLISCEGENIDKEKPIVTGDALDITERTATICAWCNVEGADGLPVVFGVEYTSEEFSVGLDEEVRANEKDDQNKYTCKLTKLRSNTLYYYRAFVLYNGIRTYGEAKSFKTLNYNATVTTLDATDISGFKATLNGKLTVDSKGEVSASCFFICSNKVSTLDELKMIGSNTMSGTTWNTSGNFENGVVTNIIDVESDGSFSFIMDDLIYGETYYYVAVTYLYGKGNVYGEMKSFSTTGDIRVETLDATDITEFTVELNGKITCGDEIGKKVYFLYSDTVTTLEEFKSIIADAHQGKLEDHEGCRRSSLSDDGSFTAHLSHLEYNTTYYYVAVAEVFNNNIVENDGIVYGDVESFSTRNITVETLDATEVSVFSAIINGKISEMKSRADIKVNFFFSETASTLEELKTNGQSLGDSYYLDPQSDGMFNDFLYDLSDNTKYYYVAVAEITNNYTENAKIYGEVNTFTTQSYIGIEDVIDLSFTGVSGNIYTDWSGKNGSSSSAVYAGNSAGGSKGNACIQLRSKNNNSGIVSTASGGKLTKVSLTWNAQSGEVGNTAARVVQVYGSTTAYASPSDLYTSGKQGTLVGELTYGKDTELTVSGNYAYVGLRSKENALYLDEIRIIWR